MKYFTVWYKDGAEDTFKAENSEQAIQKAKEKIKKEGFSEE